MSTGRTRMSLFIAMAVISLTVLSAIPFGPSGYVDAEEPGNVELFPSFIYMKPPNGLSPEVPDVGTNDLTATIPDGFVRDGPFGRGLLPFLGHVEWREVGVWTSQPLKETINIGQTVTIKMWAQGKPGVQNQVSCDFEFILTRADEANAIVQLNINNVAIPNGVDGGYVSFTTFQTLPYGNATQIEANSQLSLRVRARCNGGAILVYGSPSHDSGFELYSNSLKPHVMVMNRESVSMEYKDAFLVPYTKINKRLLVNDFQVDNKELESDYNSENQTRILIWPVSNNPGSYEVSISLSYDLTGERNVSISETLTVRVKKIDATIAIWNFLKSSIPYLLVIALVVAGLVVYNKHRKKVWRRRVKKLPETDRNLSFHKQKKAWKKHVKEEKLKRRADRKERLRRLEDEEAEAGFSLFKRTKATKEPVARRTKVARTTAVEVGSVEPAKRIEDLSSLDL